MFLARPSIFQVKAVNVVWVSGDNSEEDSGASTISVELSELGSLNGLRWFGHHLL